MLESVKNYVYDRRQGLSTFLGFAGGLYAGKRYLTDRLEEVKEGMEQERGAKEMCVFDSLCKFWDLYMRV